MKYALIVRAYAPFPSFGAPPFHGDDRGPSTSPNVGSRLKAWIVFDPTTGKIETPSAKCDESHLSRSLRGHGDVQRGDLHRLRARLPGPLRHQ